MRPSPTAQHWVRDERGSATVEVAIALPVVMLLLMLVVQAGVYFHTQAVATTAANKGLDALRVETGTAHAATDTTSRFLDRHAPALRSSDIDAARTGDTAQVTVSGDVVSLVFGVDLFPVRVTASAPVEQVTP